MQVRHRQTKSCGHGICQSLREPRACCPLLRYCLGSRDDEVVTVDRVDSSGQMKQPERSTHDRGTDRTRHHPHVRVTRKYESSVVRTGRDTLFDIKRVRQIWHMHVRTRHIPRIIAAKPLQDLPSLSRTRDGGRLGNRHLLSSATGLGYRRPSNRSLGIWPTASTAQCDYHTHSGRNRYRRESHRSLQLRGSCSRDTRGASRAQSTKRSYSHLVSRSARWKRPSLLLAADALHGYNTGRHAPQITGCMINDQRCGERLCAHLP
jgi:hypothetical protein